MSEHMEQRVCMSLCVVSYQKVRRPASHRHVVVSLEKAVVIIKFKKKKKKKPKNPVNFKIFLFSSLIYKINWVIFNQIFLYFLRITEAL